MDVTYSFDLYFHASQIGASTYMNHIRAFSRLKAKSLAILISEAFSFILHRVKDSNSLKSLWQARVQFQKWFSSTLTFHHKIRKQRTISNYITAFGFKRVHRNKMQKLKFMFNFFLVTSKSLSYYPVVVPNFCHRHPPIPRVVRGDTVPRLTTLPTPVVT